MRKIAYLFMLIPIVFSACKGKFYKQYQDIPKLQWQRSNVVKFEVDIQDIEAAYRITIGFRYTTHIHQNAIPVIVGMVSPAGKTTSENYIIQLKDAKGEHLGEAMHDLADREQEVKKGFKFTEKGKHYFTITQASDAEDLGGIMEVGLVLEK
jgi:gliding motility-associated lipoprotein GldH